MCCLLSTLALPHQGPSSTKPASGGAPFQKFCLGEGAPAWYPAWTQLWTGSELQSFVDPLPSGRTQTLPPASLASRLRHPRDAALDLTGVRMLMILPEAFLGLAVTDGVEGRGAGSSQLRWSVRLSTQASRGDTLPRLVTESFRKLSPLRPRVAGRGARLRSCRAG